MRFWAGRIDHHRAAIDQGWHRPAIVAGVEHRDERIVVETSNYRITGMLRLPRDGYRSRLTDYLNAAERTFLQHSRQALMQG